MKHWPAKEHFTWFPGFSWTCSYISIKQLSTVADVKSFVKFAHYYCRWNKGIIKNNIFNMLVFKSFCTLLQYSRWWHTWIRNLYEGTVNFINGVHFHCKIIYFMSILSVFIETIDHCSWNSHTLDYIRGDKLLADLFLRVIFGLNPFNLGD